MCRAGGKCMRFAATVVANAVGTWLVLASPSSMRVCVEWGCVLWCAQTDVYEVKKEALFVVANLAVRGTADHIAYLVENDAVPALAGMLDAPNASHITTALEALHSVLTPHRGPGARDLLEACSAVRTIEALQYHSSHEVYRLAVRSVAVAAHAFVTQDVAPAPVNEPRVQWGVFTCVSCGCAAGVRTASPTCRTPPSQPGRCRDGARSHGCSRYARATSQLHSHHARARVGPACEL